MSDNELGDIDMPVNVVDMDVGAGIDFANEFAQQMGIERKDSPHAHRKGRGWKARRAPGED